MSDREPPDRLPLALLAGERDESTRWIVTLLERAGFGVLHERAGERALARARVAEPAVIVVDGDLADTTGVALCGMLARDPRIGPGTPILVSFAGAVSRKQRLAALRAGAWDCIATPHDGREIVARLRTYGRAKLDADRARLEGLVDAQTGLYNRQGLARQARALGSLAVRDHSALACLALALDWQPDSSGHVVDNGSATAAVVRCARTLKALARNSDVVARVGPTEFALLTPGTDAVGARLLADRLTAAIETSARSPAPGAAPAPGARVRCGYDAVANMGYAPIEPFELLARASAALRTGRVELGGRIRQFDPGPAPPE